MTAALMLAEWTKLRSVRSTLWSLATAALLMLGMSTLAIQLTMSAWGDDDPAGRADVLADPIALVLQPGALWATIPVLVLGVMVIAAEYSSGTIRASLLAVPTRTPMLLAKAAVFAGAVFVLGVLAAVATFWTGRALMHEHVPVSLGDPGVPRAIVGVGLYLAAMGVLGLAIGALIRHVGGAVAAAVVLVVLASMLSTLLPGTVGRHVNAYLPDHAGSMLLSNGHSPDALLSPWQGFGVLCLWVTVLMAAAAYQLRRRDA